MSKPSPALQAVRDIKAMCFIEEDQGRGDEVRTWATLDEDLAAERIEEVIAEHQRVLELVDNVLASVQDYAATLSCTSQNEREVWNDVYSQTTNALAEIAKLINE